MDDGNGMEYAEPTDCAVCEPEQAPTPYVELERALDVLDDCEQRADETNSAAHAEYVKSGIRTAKHHIFQAMKAL